MRCCTSLLEHFKYLILCYMILNFEINSFVLLDRWRNSNTFPWRSVFLGASCTPPSEPQGTLWNSRSMEPPETLEEMLPWKCGCRISSFGAREKSAQVSHRENPVLEQTVMSSLQKRVPQKNPVLERCLKRVPHSFGFPSGWIVKACRAVLISPNWVGGITGVPSNHSAHQEWRYSKETILLFFPLAIILLKQWSVKLELYQDLTLGKWKAGARRAARLEIYLLEKDLHLVLTLQQKMTWKRRLELR